MNEKDTDFKVLAKKINNTQTKLQNLHYYHRADKYSPKRITVNFPRFFLKTM